MNKYELTDEYIKVFGKKLYRIKALRDFGDVEVGDLGGFVESTDNLSQYDKSWVCGDARVYGNAKVCGDALVCGEMRITSVDDISIISNFGSANRTTTFALSKDKKLVVRCGCFYGTIDEFRSKVKETHNDSYLAKEYLMIADLMEFRFRNREEQNND